LSGFQMIYLFWTIQNQTNFSTKFDHFILKQIFL
jgi:hypothetical protein